MDLQRAYNVVCLMVGSNPGKFASVADAAKLPPERQMTCQDDYLNAKWSWDQVLQSHLRKPIRRRRRSMSSTVRETESTTPMRRSPSR